MSKNRSSALKRDREQRKAEKHAQKRLRRDERKQGEQQDQGNTTFENPTEPPEVLAQAGSSTSDTQHDNQSSLPQSGIA